VEEPEIPLYAFLDLLFDGAYCTNLDRQIVYWNPAAEILVKR